MDTFQRILKLPEPRESLPRSSTVVMCLDDEKGRQNLDQEVLPPCCLSIQSLKMPLINLIRTSKQNLPEGKYIQPPPPTVKWYQPDQSCYEVKIQELNTDLPGFVFLLSHLGSYGQGSSSNS